MNNVYIHFVLAQPHSFQLLGDENYLFSPLLLRGSWQKCHFCPPQAEVNLVVPKQMDVNVFFYIFVIA